MIPIGLALPLLRRLAGPLLIIAALAGLIGVAFAAGHKIYNAGYEAAKAVGERTLAQHEAEAANERAEHALQMVELDKVIRDQQAAAARRFAAAEARARQAEQQTEGALNANPEFAAVVRPVALRGLRDADFAELEHAANRGASLHNPGLPVVPAADAGPGPDLGRLRANRPGEPGAVAGMHQLP
jgi:hypothetical protein